MTEQQNKELEKLIDKLHALQVDFFTLANKADDEYLWKVSDAVESLYLRISQNVDL